MYYCKHGFCKGIKDCQDFLPANGSMLCIYSPMVGTSMRAEIYLEHYWNCLFFGLFPQATYWRNKIINIKTEERLSKDGCDLAVDLHDGKGWVDE
jgi:hypothetical protein